jgi:hypothetical protein
MHRKHMILDKLIEIFPEIRRFLLKNRYVPLTSYRPTKRFFFPNHISRQLSDVSEDMRTDGTLVKHFTILEVFNFQLIINKNNSNLVERN